MATQKPLSIWITSELLDHPKVTQWMAQGHSITLLPTVYDSEEATTPIKVDVIFGPKAWRMPVELFDQYGDMALKVSQELIYGKVPNKKASKGKAPKSKRKSPSKRGAKAKAGASSEGGGGEVSVSQASVGEGNSDSQQQPGNGQGHSHSEHMI